MKQFNILINKLSCYNNLVLQEIQMFEIILYTTITIVSLFFLIQGAEWLMKGAVAIAENMNVSKLAIASTLIAFGTGLPTIAVNVALVLLNSNGADAAVGNALGTNYVNIGLALGIPAFLLTINTKYKVFEKEIPIYLGITSLYTAFALDGGISRIEGIVLLVCYLITLYIIYQYSLREKLKVEDHDELDINTSSVTEIKTEGLSMIYAFVYLALGLILLIVFSIVLANMTPLLSHAYGVSQYVLGLTVIGIGTSLPTIVTSIRAGYKGYADIVLGNVFGGLIANIGLGIGFVAIIHDLPFSTEAVSDTYYFSLLNMVVLFGVLIEMKLLGNSKTLSKISGLVMIVLYLIYIASKLI
jgi:cation:H+ antiporter